MRDWLEKHQTELGLMVAGGVLVGIGVFVWRLEKTSGETKVEIINQQIAGETTSSGKLIVDIAGEVIKPGVYEMQPGDRVVEALIMAGGLTGKADINWVGKYLNQAEKVKDGMKIFIPRVEELKSGRVEAGTEQKTGKININIASEGELDTLPGIGPVTAKKIISGRPYGRKEELLERKVVTAKVYSQIQEAIEVW